MAGKVKMADKLVAGECGERRKGFYMKDSSEIFQKIIEICSSVTEHTYDSSVRQGYELLLLLHDAGLEENSVYETLFQSYNSLADDLSRDCFADIMDFVCGWCSPQKDVWKEK